MKSLHVYDNKDKLMDTLFYRSLKIAAVVANYWFISISMVFINKYLLSSKQLKLNAPLFVTWYQCVVTVLLCALLSFISSLFPSKLSFPPFKIDPKLCWTTLPLSVIFVGMISFNNLCLKYVEVPFYYISRSLSTVFNVILSYIVLKQATSIPAIGCCAVIIAGFTLGVDQEGVSGSLSITGVIFGVFASASVAMNAIFTKKILPMVDNNVWRLTLYNNINATILFIPLMLFFGEVNTVLTFPHLGNIHFWYVMSISGLLGFAIGYATGLQIQYTSPLTHNVSGTAKACAQTIIACTYSGDVKSFLWWFSNLTVLFGSMGYTEVKRREMKKQHTKELQNPKPTDKDIEQQQQTEKLLPVKS